MKTTLKLACASILGAALLAPKAAGYEHIYKWPYGPYAWPDAGMELSLSAGDFKTNMASRYDMINVVHKWNAAPVNFELKLAYDDYSYSLGNKQSEAYFTSSNYIMSGAVGVARFQTFGSAIKEVDISFNALEDFTFDEDKVFMWPYAGDDWSFRAVAMHEVGHALGLGHEAYTYNVMGVPDTHVSTNGSWANCYPGEDATHGAIALYGMDNGGAEDVGITHWYRTGQIQGYSWHDRTEVYGPDLKALPTVPDPGNPGEVAYEVSRGQTVKTEFGFENNGSTSQKLSAGYYVSTNDTITTYDTLLLTAHPTVNRNKVYHRSQWLTIPSNLPVGSIRYLGVVVDRHDSLDEINESNNATYVAIKVVD